MTRQRRRLLPGGALVAHFATTALLLGACTTQPPAETPWAGEPFPELAGDLLAEAAAGGASDEQLELIRLAQDAGEVKPELLRVAGANTIACFGEFGGGGELNDWVRSDGLVIPGYLGEFDETLGEAVIESGVEACQVREYQWINRLYFAQPSSREVVGQYVMSREPELRECLERHGYDTDPESNGWELAIFAAQIAAETDFDVNCLSEADIYSL